MKRRTGDPVSLGPLKDPKYSLKDIFVIKIPNMAAAVRYCRVTDCMYPVSTIVILKIHGCMRLIMHESWQDIVYLYIMCSASVSSWNTLTSKKDTLLCLVN